MKLKLTYMSGAGNLFTVINNESAGLSISDAQKLAPELCGTKYNDYATEGLMLISNGDSADLTVHFFNPDGSYGAMCGNGGRCVVPFALNEKLTNERSTFTFNMASDVYRSELTDAGIRLFLPPPRSVTESISLYINDGELDAGYVDVNSDHVVIEFTELSKIGIADFSNHEAIIDFARTIRYSEQFAPKGTNVNIWQIQDDKLKLMTYERGVEAITGACGTGALSTAIIYTLKKKKNFPVKIMPPSGKELTADVVYDAAGKIKNLILEGSAEIISKKEIEINL